jgi:sulfoxide reductase heme-binding subunit YedZ
MAISRKLASKLHWPPPGLRYNARGWEIGVMGFLRERSGAWCPEKIIAFAGAVAPALWLSGRVLLNDLGPRPVTEVTHFTGDWTVRFLYLALAVSPARRIFMAPRLILMRRSLGVAAFAYAFVHLSLYVLDQHFDLGRVAWEIVLRFYLTIGFVALLGLTALAATSFDRAIRQLGSQRWNQLHRAVYAIAVLAQVHFLLQSKNDVWQPMLMLGFLAWLFGYRLLFKFAGEVTSVRLIGLAAVSAALTAVSETTWYAVRTGVDPWLVFSANFDFSYEIRPAWLVLASGLAVAAAGWIWRQRTTLRKMWSRAFVGEAGVQSAS